ncbi:hypothetical protein H4582DRAFT_2062351 [Lactarius indigo]|nr:hypothetical protein H4582DRAFT_2062351 [Lactarius indigo]
MSICMIWSDPVILLGQLHPRCSRAIRIPSYTIGENLRRTDRHEAISPNETTIHTVPPSVPRADRAPPVPTLSATPKLDNTPAPNGSLLVPERFLANTAVINCQCTNAGFHGHSSGVMGTTGIVGKLATNWSALGFVNVTVDVELEKKKTRTPQSLGMRTTGHTVKSAQ